jgi:hypothetical protein
VGLLSSYVYIKLKLKPKLPWRGRRESDGMGMIFGYICHSSSRDCVKSEVPERSEAFETERVCDAICAKCRKEKMVA